MGKIRGIREQSSSFYPHFKTLSGNHSKVTLSMSMNCQFPRVWQAWAEKIRAFRGPPPRLDYKVEQHLVDGFSTYTGGVSQSPMPG